MRRSLSISCLCQCIPHNPPKTAIICSYIQPRFAAANRRFKTPDPSVYRELANKFNNWLQWCDLPQRIFLTWGGNRLENINSFKSDLVHLNAKGIKLLWYLLKTFSWRLLIHTYTAVLRFSRCHSYPSQLCDTTLLRESCKLGHWPRAACISPPSVGRIFCPYACPCDAAFRRSISATKTPKVKKEEKEGCAPSQSASSISPGWRHDPG